MSDAVPPKAPDVLTVASTADARSDTGSRAGALQGVGSGGTIRGMDPWQHSVEMRLGELRGDVRQVLYASVGSTAFLLAAFAAGFLVLLARIDASADRILARVDARVDVLSQQTASISERTARIEGALGRPEDTGRR